MKKVLFALAALITLAACENKQKAASSTENGNDSSEVDVVLVLSDENEGTYFSAIDQYLAEEIGSRYAKGEFCVPFHSIVGVDERNSEDILV
jgi:ABC-type glycerol-3-phosphate transport system substrate-binding protein